MFQVNVTGSDPVTVHFVGALTAGCREAVARVIKDAGWHAPSIVIDLREVTVLDEACAAVVRQAVVDQHPRLQVQVRLPVQAGSPSGEGRPVTS